eukprot:Skav211647  [mRNA]  locus=scaffold1290:266969:269718:+ [translate_table: standard]
MSVASNILWRMRTSIASTATVTSPDGPVEDASTSQGVPQSLREKCTREYPRKAAARSSCSRCMAAATPSPRLTGGAIRRRSLNVRRTTSASRVLSGEGVSIAKA